MRLCILGYTLATCLVVCLEGTGNEINAKPNTNYYRFEQDEQDIEEYFIEHAISTLQAKNAIKLIDWQSVKAKAGCQECTSYEKRYCLGPQLMNDHCCCDKRYSEFFSYVPHTCYIGEKLCKPLARDCAEYTRIRTCCCDKLVLEKWKQIFSSATQPKIYEHFYLLLLTTLISLLFY